MHEQGYFKGDSEATWHAPRIQELQGRTGIAGLPITRISPALLPLISKFPGPWGKAAKLWPTLQDMWKRRSSDDLAFMLLLAINSFVTDVPSTQVNMGDAESLVAMCTKCQKEILACVRDPQCKKALDGLAACGLNDQVCHQHVSGARRARCSDAMCGHRSATVPAADTCFVQKPFGKCRAVPSRPDPSRVTALLLHCVVVHLSIDPFNRWSICCHGFGVSLLVGLHMTGHELAISWLSSQQTVPSNDPQLRRARERAPPSREPVSGMQVCSYRVLASFESPLLEQFSRCILQKHNCLRNSADIPMLPAPTPLRSFRGELLTWEAAEGIFMGHLAERQPKARLFSWRVAAGKNPGTYRTTHANNVWYIMNRLLEMRAHT
jgi:hypothetical protein